MKSKKISIAIISAVAVMSVVSIGVGVNARSNQHSRYKNTILDISDEEQDDLDLNDDKTVDVMDYCLYKGQLLQEVTTTLPSVTTDSSDSASQPAVTTKATSKPAPVTTKATTPAPTPPPTQAPTPTPPPVTEAPDPNADWYPGKGMSMRDVDPGWDGSLKWGARTEEQMAFIEYCVREANNRSNLDQAFNDAIAQWEYYDGPEAAIEDLNEGKTSVERILHGFYGDANGRVCSPDRVAQEICEQHGKNVNDYHSEEDNAYWSILGGADCGGHAYANACDNYYTWGVTTAFFGYASAEHAECSIMLSPYTREWTHTRDGLTEEHVYEGSWYRFDRDLETVKNKLREYGWEG